tara:strand:+ start:5495 stop:6346 length:852 start_codon:yes stop_codon:yes gene_type:complete
MANNFAAALAVDTLAEESITTLGPVLAVLDNFSLDVAVSPVAPGSRIQVEVVNSGATALVNPGDYTSDSDSQKQAKSITVNQHSVSFKVTQAELNNGHRLRTLLRKNMQVIATACRDAVFAPITTANYGSAVLHSTATDFDASDLQTIWGACKDFPTRNLILDGAYFSKLLPTNADSFLPGSTGAYGFDSLAMNNRWDGADAKVIGFCGAADALAIASGEPIMDDEIQDLLSFYEPVELPGGLTAYLSSFTDINKRSRYMNISVMLGAAVGDATAGAIITDGS